MRLIWSNTALEDARRIDEYLTAHDPQAAASMLRAINAKARPLREFSALGPPIDQATRYASVSRTPYVIVFAIRTDHVRIGRIYDSRQDWRGHVELE